MIEISLDGIRWEEAARGEFANIQNNPVEQQVIFRQTHKGRYIRFHALSHRVFTTDYYSIFYR